MGSQPVFLKSPGIVERWMREKGADTILQKFVCTNIRGMNSNISSVISSLGSSSGLMHGASNQSSAVLLLTGPCAVLAESNFGKDPSLAPSFLDHKLLEVRPPSHWGINE